MEQVFSAPGRTELGGNHTDHQHGCVLAAAVDLHTVARVRLNGLGVIRVASEGFAPVQVALGDWSPRASERHTTAALVRGVAAEFARRGAALQGFDAQVTSDVLPGSGLSSSAAFEVLLGRILNGLTGADLSPVELAKIGQYAENVYFGKPCGLMDQMASSVGGMVFMDFAQPEDPAVERLDFDASACGHALCIIDTGASHAGLTDAYAAIPRELEQLCACFGAQVLRQVPQEDFYAALPRLRGRVPDRALLRAMHVYEENRRVVQQVQALKRGDFAEFLELVRASGRSSWMYLQNVAAPDGQHQELALALALCEKLLQGSGACRVHGGGFAGTVQAWVPVERLEAFCKTMDGLFACRVLGI